MGDKDVFLLPGCLQYGPGTVSVFLGTVVSCDLNFQHLHKGNFPWGTRMLKDVGGCDLKE